MEDLKNLERLEKLNIEVQIAMINVQDITIHKYLLRLSLNLKHHINVLEDMIYFQRSKKKLEYLVSNV
jgi:hypothetical protein